MSESGDGYRRKRGEDGGEEQEQTHKLAFNIQRQQVVDRLLLQGEREMDTLLGIQIKILHLCL